jgi:hypothetical protein
VLSQGTRVGTPVFSGKVHLCSLTGVVSQGTPATHHHRYAMQKCFIYKTYLLDTPAAHQQGTRREVVMQLNPNLDAKPELGAPAAHQQATRREIVMQVRSP